MSDVSVLDSGAFYTVAEVAQRLRISDKTVRREIARGRLHVTARVGLGERNSRILISEKDIAAYLAKGRAA